MANSQRILPGVNGQWININAFPPIPSDTNQFGDVLVRLRSGARKLVKLHELAEYELWAPCADFDPRPIDAPFSPSPTGKPELKVGQTWITKSGLRTKITGSKKSSAPLYKKLGPCSFTADLGFCYAADGKAYLSDDPNDHIKAHELVELASDVLSTEMKNHCSSISTRLVSFSEMLDEVGLVPKGSQLMLEAADLINALSAHNEVDE